MVRQKIYTRQKIIKILRNLPKDKPINAKQLILYQKQGLICHLSLIQQRVGTIKEACKLAGLLCNAISNGKEKGKYMSKLNKKYYKKDITNGLKLIYKKYGKIKLIELPKYLKKENLFCQDIIKKYFNTISNAFNQLNIPYQDYYWSDKRILSKLKEYYNKHGPFYKSDIDRKLRKPRVFPGSSLIANRFGTLEKAAKKAGIKFKPYKFTIPHIGPNETQILNNVEKEQNIKILRSYRVGRYHLDGYDKENNIAYEVDENHHLDNIFKDKIREEKIKNMIGCGFVRIKDY